jgi:cytochrome b
MDGEDAPRLRRVRLWDPALRAFHWTLAAAFAFSYAMGEFGPTIMTLHFWSGYLVIALLAFRLVWGLIGPRPARFAQFVTGPAAVAAYARDLPARRPSRWPGHNPLGGWSVVALLLTLAALALTGLLSDPDDYINAGPLAGAAPRWLSRAANGWHEALGGLALALVGLHLAAIAFYRIWKREDLVRPMIDGEKLVDERLG